MHLAHLALIVACLPACDDLAAFWLPKIVTLTCLDTKSKVWQSQQNWAEQVPIVQVAFSWPAAAP